MSILQNEPYKAAFYIPNNIMLGGFGDFPPEVKKNIKIELFKGSNFSYT